MIHSIAIWFKLLSGWIQKLFVFKTWKTSAFLQQGSIGSGQYFCVFVSYFSTRVIFLKLFLLFSFFKELIKRYIYAIQLKNIIIFENFLQNNHIQNDHALRGYHDSRLTSNRDKTTQSFELESHLQVKINIILTHERNVYHCSIHGKMVIIYSLPILKLNSYDQQQKHQEGNK